MNPQNPRRNYSGPYIILFYEIILAVVSKGFYFWILLSRNSAYATITRNTCSFLTGLTW